MSKVKHDQIDQRFDDNIAWTVLGGELPTARGCGLVHPSDVHGIRSGLIHSKNWGELTHLLSGMSHQVGNLIHRKYRVYPKRGERW
jgi:hypothetical protein